MAHDHDPPRGPAAVPRPVTDSAWGWLDSWMGAWSTVLGTPLPAQGGGRARRTRTAPAAWP